MNLFSIILTSANLISQKDITKHSDVIADGNYLTPVQRTVYYNVDNFNHNNRAVENKAIVFFARDGNVSPTISNTKITGGFTCEPNQSSTTNGYMRANLNPANPFGFRTGEVATNGLNGSSFYIGGIDFNNNGKIGKYKLYEDTSWQIEFEQGEGFVGNTLVANNVPAFPSSTNRVSIGQVNLVGWQDLNSNQIPDYYESMYPLTAGKPINSDTDLDGRTDRQEWIVGTNPIQPDNYSIGYLGTNLFIPSLLGRRYQIEHRNDFNSSWTLVDTLNGISGNTVYNISNLPFEKGHLRVNVDLNSGEGF